MYQIKIITSFSSAHSLRNYKGKCEALHGHNWKVEVLVSSDTLNDIGIVMDFKDLKRLTKDVIDELDHAYLNDLDSFKTINPSSERIAQYIFEKLQAPIAQQNAQLDSVNVWETENSCATYRK